MQWERRASLCYKVLYVLFALLGSGNCPEDSGVIDL